MESRNFSNENEAWTTAILRNLPTVAVPAPLEQAILASFDGVTARRNSGLSGALRRITAAVWPGAPAWRPVAAMAFSLVIGVLAGTFVPLEGAMADNNDQAVSVALDAPPTFDLDENS
ncbi:MAG TPA: hypothetical protein VHE09_04400 [Rhizomicrobium sp.]|jgi:hypothetical protein|nr:hypothetical protein [Rhizomicrobium sp.]